MTTAKTFEFIVEGNDPFPMDMLRYDGCWPSQSNDSFQITHSVDGTRVEHHRKISLSGIKKPTVDRWRSFGWQVTMR